MMARLWGNGVFFRLFHSPVVPGYELPHDQEDAVRVASLGQKRANPWIFICAF
jgi:hypothetical protein